MNDYPTPEQRVRDYLDAVNTDGDGFDFIAEVGIGGPMLLASDVRDVLAEIAAYRDALETIGCIIRAGGSGWHQVHGIQRVVHSIHEEA